MSDKYVEQLADKVVSAVKKAGIREDIIDVLQQALENQVRDAATQQLLVCVGLAINERDREWVRQLAGEWAPRSGLRTATNPAEVEAEIKAWHAARVSEVRVGAYEAGYSDSFPVALQQGIKLGWGACEAGKSLEEALAAAGKIKPAGR